MMMAPHIIVEVVKIPLTIHDYILPDLPDRGIRPQVAVDLEKGDWMGPLLQLDFFSRNLISRFQKAGKPPRTA